MFFFEKLKWNMMKDYDDGDDDDEEEEGEEEEEQEIRS